MITHGPMGYGYAWHEYEDRCQTAWQREHPDGCWSDVRVAYRYGWQSAVDLAYQGCAFEAIAAVLGRAWRAYAERITGHAAAEIVPWARARQTVRAGWDYAKRETPLPYDPFAPSQP